MPTNYKQKKLIVDEFLKVNGLSLTKKDSFTPNVKKPSETDFLFTQEPFSFFFLHRNLNAFNIIYKITDMQISKLIIFYFFLKDIDFHFILETSTFFLYCRGKIKINNNSWLRIFRKSLGIESRLAS